VRVAAEVAHTVSPDDVELLVARPGCTTSATRPARSIPASTLDGARLLERNGCHNAVRARRVSLGRRYCADAIDCSRAPSLPGGDGSLGDALTTPTRPVSGRSTMALDDRLADMCGAARAAARQRGCTPSGRSSSARPPAGSSAASQPFGDPDRRCPPAPRLAVEPLTQLCSSGRRGVPAPIGP